MEKAAHVVIHTRLWTTHNYSAGNVAPLLDVLSIWMAGVEQLLERVRAGNETALDELVKLLYDELHQIAATRLRHERASHTLQATALVHEAYLKLARSGQGKFADRAHFLAIASRVMRQVLVDYARTRSTRKRGGDELRQSPADQPCSEIEMPDSSGPDRVQVLDLDVALEALARQDEWLARLIEMRYFAGMTAEEIAEAMGRSVNMVRQDQRLAQAWLRRALNAPTGSNPPETS
jgi:RNA polymerase sigma-70 factor, ECF subfamily